MSNIRHIKTYVVQHYQKEIGKLQSKKQKLLNRLDKMKQEEKARGRKNVIKD
ncbi:hypothetical protein KY326_03740 [Candidatus Woesearchaeota archaeon]|nr:hypothetical protein [Candidatus Woesearchaeota archaeon]